MNDNKNKSSAYGFYGGVTNENHYVPGPSDAFIPQEPKQTTEDLLTEVEEAVQFLESYKSDILLRTKVKSEQNNVDTFVMKTIGDPNETITYRTTEDDATLGDLAGEGFIDKNDTSDSNVVDGGTF